MSARNEAQALVAILRHAQGSDVVFAASLLMLAVPKKTKRRRRDLTPDEFDFLVSYVDVRQRPATRACCDARIPNQRAVLP